MNQVYHDKNGIEIKAGMTIQHDDGDTELVYACGEDDLGVNASNKAFLKAHPDVDQEFYPLYQFNLKQWAIIPKEESV